MLEPDHWFDQALAYSDAYERVDGAWLFRRRSLKSWYRQAFGHPTEGTERGAIGVMASGPQRGTQLPEAFPTFEAFWARPPRPLPGAGSGTDLQ